MTTASLTRNAIDNFTPIIYQDGVELSAPEFADANFRHLINRRMTWSNVQAFVTEALNGLVRARNGRPGVLAALRQQMFTVSEIVRRAANRRRSYSLVQAELVTALVAVVEAARSYR